MKSISWRASLIHWGRVMHICDGNLTSFGSDNGLSPGQHQPIVCTNVRILLIGPLETNFTQFSIELFMSLIVLYFLHSTSVPSFYIAVVLTLSTSIFNKESACESYVCELAAILYRPQCVKWSEISQSNHWQCRKYYPMFLLQNVYVYLKDVDITKVYIYLTLYIRANKSTTNNKRLFLLYLSISLINYYTFYVVQHFIWLSLLHGHLSLYLKSLSSETTDCIAWQH